jgi:transcriptional regulator with XRE-family HTH domain
MPHTFGVNLRHYRQAKGWTQDELARQVGVRKNTVCYYEQGRIEPKVSRLCRLAAALGVSVCALLAEPQAVRRAGRHDE